MLRAALYIRVSTEEQALHGYSLEAQREALTKYAKQHDMQIVDYYVDEGFSARKKYTNRKEFMRMLRDVERDVLDIILFIKLDRWFRSVKDYYKIQEVLESHNVGWKTTEENYDTTTTNGRLYINIRLSVAQDESDRTSDRIKFVFDSKVSRGEVISGAQPIGFKIENKHLVHDAATADMVRDMFEYFALHQNKYATMRYIHDKYGVFIEKSNIKNHLTNTLYIGEYRGNLNYCEPLIDVETFQKVQGVFKRTSVRKAPTGRVYIFSGLLRCATCGRTMSGRYAKIDPREYYHYRCNLTSTHLCDNTIAINEQKIEGWLLDNIENIINSYIASYHTLAAKVPKPTVNKAKIRRKLSKLKELYVNDLISMEEYKSDYERYNSELAEVENSIEAPIQNLRVLSDFLKKDIKEVYEVLDKKGRQALWRSIIREIHIDYNKNMKVFFI